MDNITQSKKTWPMRMLCFLAIGLICSSFGYAYGINDSDAIIEIQQESVAVQGRVVNIKGEPLVGASVTISGTTTAVLTNADGAYSITVPSGNSLKYEFSGYATQTKVVSNQSTINVIMDEDPKIMDQIVIVGYGSQKLENLTGSVASVDVGKTLASRPITDVGRGLQGSVPGLSVVVRSGEVGSDPSIKIRGFVGSYTGSADPLILVDNVEIPSIQIVNPDDIESISVLKDAASTSIYGSKGAFGVILITTKKGAKTDMVSVSYSGNFSWQNRAKELNMAGVDGLQYALDGARSRDPRDPKTGQPFGTFIRYNEESIQKSREWIEKYAKTGLVKPGDPVVYGRDWYVDPVTNARMGIRTYDAVDALVANWTPTMTHNLSVNGRSNKTAYNIGLGLLDQTGMTRNAKADDFRRYNASVKLSTDINKYLTLRAGTMYSDRIKRFPSVSGYTADPWLYAYRWGSLMPVGVTDQFGDPLRNPAYELSESTTSKTRNIYTNINLGATVNFTKDWNLEFDYTFVTQEDIAERSYPRFTYKDPWMQNFAPVPWLDENGERVYVDEAGNITTEGGMPGYTFPWIVYPSLPAVNEDGTLNTDDAAYISRSSFRSNTHTYNVYTTYNLKIGDRHAFKFMLGMNQIAYDTNGHAARIGGLYDFDNPQFNFTVNGKHTASGSADWNSVLGFFGRINYAFADKYLLEANLRYDGTSKFPREMWWATFPAFSAGWVISNENFYKPVERIVNFAKIRASWGSIGDQSVSNSIYLRTMNRSQSSWLGADGLGIWTNATPNAAQGEVKWQRIENLDIGIDLQFLQGRLGLTFDWFQRNTKDMIMPGDALPYTYGATAPMGNFGNMRTRGWEVSLTYDHRFHNGLGISALATVWDNQSIVTKGPDYRTPWENRSIGSSWSTGARYGDIWGYVTDRLYQEEDFVRGPDGNFEKTWIVIDGTSKLTHLLAGDNPVYQTQFEDGNGVVIFRPGDVKFHDLNGDGYITRGEGTFGNPGDRKVIGNSTPRYEYGFRLGLDFKGFDFSVFVQGVGSRQMWGAGQLAIPGFHLADGAVPQAIASDYWRPDNTGAFYPRPWDNGGENTNYSLQIQTRYLLNMAYTRIKNITLGYSLPARLLKKAYITKARFYVSLENFITFDNLRGLPIDPETVTGYSMFSSSYNLSRTGTGTPMFKSASAGVQLSF